MKQIVFDQYECYFLIYRIYLIIEMSLWIWINLVFLEYFKWAPKECKKALGYLWKLWEDSFVFRHARICNICFDSCLSLFWDGSVQESENCLENLKLIIGFLHSFIAPLLHFFFNFIKLRITSLKSWCNSDVKSV